MDDMLVRWADRLAWTAAALAALAALAGIATGAYRDNALMVAQARGQDLVTLFGAVPALALGLAVDLSMTPVFGAICVVTGGLLVVGLLPARTSRAASAPAPA